MASEAQIAANRRNAERSTGPKSAEGKARVAQNGLKHGLCAAEPVLPWEDRAAFDALLADLTARLQPADEIELALLAQYADAMWRRQRCATLETGALADAMPETAEGCPEGVHPTVWAMGQALAGALQGDQPPLPARKPPRPPRRARPRPPARGAGPPQAGRSGSRIGFGFAASRISLSRPCGRGKGPVAQRREG